MVSTPPADPAQSDAPPPILALSHIKTLLQRAAPGIEWSKEAVASARALVEAHALRVAAEAAERAKAGGRKRVQPDHVAAPAPPAGADSSGRENQALAQLLAYANRDLRALGRRPYLRGGGRP